MRSLFKKTTISIFSQTLFLIFIFPPPTLASLEKSKSYFTEQLVSVGKQEPETKLYHRSVKVSPDDLHVTYVLRKGGKSTVFFDGKPGKPWNKILGGTPIFSEKRNRVAYIAIGDKAHVVVDGKVGPGFDKIWGVRFSPDGKHFAYPCSIGKGRKMKAYIAINHRKGNPVYGISEFVFSQDSRNLAYIALLKDGKWHAVLNNKVGPAHDAIDSLSFSPDGKHFSYSAKSFATNEKTIMVDFKKQKFSGRQIGMAKFSPDSSRLAYAVNNSDGMWEVIVDGKKIDTMKKAFRFIFSPDSKQYAFQGGESNQKISMYLNGLKSVVYGGCSDPYFSPDSSKFVYFAREDEDWFLVINGKKGKNYKKIFPPVFNEESGRMAYRVIDSDDRMRVIIDGKEDSAYDNVGTPFFSQDGKKLAYVITNNEMWNFVVNGKKYEKEYEAIGLARFSDNGKYFAFTGLLDGKMRLVVNGHETTTTFNQVIPEATIVFSEPNKISLLIVKIDNDIPELYRFEATWDLSTL